MKIQSNPEPKKALLTLLVVVMIFLIAPSPERWTFSFACIGCVLGNQVGVLLDAISKRFRLIGFLILAWNFYSFAAGKGQIAQTTHMTLAAFLWGYGFLSAFPQKQMALFIIGDISQANQISSPNHNEDFGEFASKAHLEIYKDYCRKANEADSKGDYRMAEHWRNEADDFDRR